MVTKAFPLFLGKPKSDLSKLSNFVSKLGLISNGIHNTMIFSFAQGYSNSKEFVNLLFPFLLMFKLVLVNIDFPGYTIYKLEETSFSIIQNSEPKDF